MTSAPTPEALREAAKQITPQMLAAAWDVVRDRYPRGPVMGPGPGFAEALAAGLAPIVAERADLTARLADVEKERDEARSQEQEQCERANNLVFRLARVQMDADGYRRHFEAVALASGHDPLHAHPVSVTVERLKERSDNYWPVVKDRDATRAECDALKGEVERLRADAPDADDALRRAIRTWSARLHIPVTRMMSHALREEFRAALTQEARDAR